MALTVAQDITVTVSCDEERLTTEGLVGVVELIDKIFGQAWHGS